MILLYVHCKCMFSPDAQYKPSGNALLSVLTVTGLPEDSVCWCQVWSFVDAILISACNNCAPVTQWWLDLWSSELFILTKHLEWKLQLCTAAAAAVSCSHLISYTWEWTTVTGSAGARVWVCCVSLFVCVWARSVFCATGRVCSCHQHKVHVKCGVRAYGWPDLTKGKGIYKAQSLYKNLLDDQFILILLRIFTTAQRCTTALCNTITEQSKMGGQDVRGFSSFSGSLI